MCGISGLVGSDWTIAQLESMVVSQRHRGPDSTGFAVRPSCSRGVALGHNRLSIIDLTDAGRQPMPSARGDVWIVFNGEIYNYLELRAALPGYPYRSHTDTEVILAAYEQWGDRCLDYLIGMFAFVIWDSRRNRLLAARDRFGVKPLHYAVGKNGTLLLSSEIKALHAAGLPAEFDDVTWATYLATGASPGPDTTFWRGVRALPAGCALSWKDGRTRTWRWYDLAERVGAGIDCRSTPEIEDEYLALLVDSVRMRFRSDVPVGLAVSGGLDSSILVGLVREAQPTSAEVTAFTFVTGHPDYDETPWVTPLLARSGHPSVLCRLDAQDVPALADAVQAVQDEPFGGIPTLAYALLFELAHDRGVTVLLDGQGLDEQWAGYDYYGGRDKGAALVQGTASLAVDDACLVPDFRRLVQPFEQPTFFPDRLRNLQYRDASQTKLPRALRYNDRASMRSSVELREPFLDHRLFELALRQPADRKIRGGVHKWLPRQLGERLLPAEVVHAAKRPVQTPQREWLRGPLRTWAEDCIESALDLTGGCWLNPSAVRAAWRSYCAGQGDSSFHVWQWINLGLMARHATATPAVQTTAGPEVRRCTSAS